MIGGSFRRNFKRLEKEQLEQIVLVTNDAWVTNEGTKTLEKDLEVQLEKYWRLHVSMPKNCTSQISKVRRKCWLKQQYTHLCACQNSRLLVKLSSITEAQYNSAVLLVADPPPLTEIMQTLAWFQRAFCYLQSLAGATVYDVHNHCFA